MWLKTKGARASLWRNGCTRAHTRQRARVERHCCPIVPTIQVSTSSLCLTTFAKLTYFVTSVAKFIYIYNGSSYRLVGSNPLVDCYGRRFQMSGTQLSVQSGHIWWSRQASSHQARTLDVCLATHVWFPSEAQPHLLYDLEPRQDHRSEKSTAQI